MTDDKRVMIAFVAQTNEAMRHLFDAERRAEAAVKMLKHLGVSTDNRWLSVSASQYYAKWLKEAN